MLLAHNEILRKIKTKAELHYYIEVMNKVLVPRKKYTPLLFLQQILEGEKSYFLLADVSTPPPAIGTYPEFAPRNVVDEIRHVEAVTKYLPDDCFKPKMHWSDRQFFWTILF